MAKNKKDEIKLTPEEQQIEKERLERLKKEEKAALINSGFIFCRDIIADPERLADAHIHPRVIEHIMRECTALCA